MWLSVSVARLVIGAVWSTKEIYECVCVCVCVYVRESEGVCVCLRYCVLGEL